MPLTSVNFLLINKLVSSSNPSEESHLRTLSSSDGLLRDGEVGDDLVLDGEAALLDGEAALCDVMAVLIDLFLRRVSAA